MSDRSSECREELSLSLASFSSSLREGISTTPPSAAIAREPMSEDGAATSTAGKGCHEERTLKKSDSEKRKKRGREGWVVGLWGACAEREHKTTVILYVRERVYMLACMSACMSACNTHVSQPQLAFPPSCPVSVPPT